jgi:hypothetical protein
LDPSIDTAAKFSDNSVTGSVARSGSFRGAALIVSAGVDSVALAADLRDRGIYVEGPITVPAALAAEHASPIQGVSKSKPRFRPAKEELPSFPGSI